MVIGIDAYGCTLSDRGDFGSLKAIVHEGGVVTDAGPTDQAAANVFVSIEDLRSWAGPAAADEGWSKGFDAMLEFAAARGWLHADGRIQVHVEVPA
ncbi:MAG: hypothetical protein QM729_02985 [Solirubrobacterales bacterium]